MTTRPVLSSIPHLSRGPRGVLDRAWVLAADLTPVGTQQAFASGFVSFSPKARALCSTSRVRLCAPSFLVLPSAAEAASRPSVLGPQAWVFAGQPWSGSHLCCLLAGNSQANSLLMAPLFSFPVK